MHTQDDLVANVAVKFSFVLDDDNNTVCYFPLQPITAVVLENGDSNVTPSTSSIPDKSHSIVAPLMQYCQNPRTRCSEHALWQDMRRAELAQQWYILVCGMYRSMCVYEV